MSELRSKQPSDISLDELIAINNEIAAITRAGVPLEPALAALAGDMPGKLGRVTAMLAERCSRGESLCEVLADKSVNLPPIYRAVVIAGVKSRRLPAALQSLSEAVHRLAETRRSIAVATIYPLILMTTAWLLLALFTSTIAPALLEGLDDLGVGGTAGLGWLATFGEWAMYWGPALPIAILLAAAVWRYRSRRVGNIQRRGGGRALAWVPWMKEMWGCSQKATFAEIFGLLVESNVPMDEALLLAADACGDNNIRESAAQLAARFRDGRTSDVSGDCCGLPPLFRWLMSGNRERNVMLPAVRQVAETYRSRAMHRATMVRTFLPVVMTVFVGGSVVLIYTLLLWMPYTAILKSITEL